MIHPLAAQIQQLHRYSAIQIGIFGPTQHDCVLLSDVLALLVGSGTPTPEPGEKLFRETTDYLSPNDDGLRVNRAEEPTTEGTRSASSQAILERALAQLRHAYQQLVAHDNRWSRRGMQDFADGLIAPQIRLLESLSSERLRVGMKDVSSGLQARIAELEATCAQVQQERDQLAKAILPDEDRRPGWTVKSLASLAEAHRSDSDFMDTTQDEITGDTMRRLKERAEKAELALQQAGSAPWHPIATAPKDGTAIDLFAEGCRYADCTWDGDGWAWDGGFFTPQEPTHWMPLPPPPQEPT